MRRPTLFLIDGMSCAYRAFYAIRDLRASSGEPTNAVYGFTTMLLKIMREQSPDAIAVVFDSPAPTFRHERFAGYKAHRKPMPEDLVAQLPVIREVVEAYRIAILQRDGLEADDLMASLAVRAARSGYDVVMVTSDKDMLQIVDDQIAVMKPDGGERCGPAAVKRRYGLQPGQVVDMLALAGDASDNVPGVPGIGEKTAVELIRTFGDLESLLGKIDAVKGERRRQLLTQYADQARLSRELVTLKADAPLDIGPDGCRVQSPDAGRVAGIFKRLEFKKLHAEAVQGEAASRREYRCVNDPAAFEEFLAGLGGQRSIAVDLETTDRDPMRAEIVGFSCSWRPHEAWYVPFNGGLDPAGTLARLAPVLQDAAIQKTGQNIKYDMIVLKNHGVELRGVAFDTMVAAHLLNPSRNSYGLDDLALEYLNERMTPISELIGSGAKAVSMREVAIPAVADYACADADVTMRLRTLLEPRIEAEGMGRIFRDLEIPFVQVLAGMEMAGVRIDTGPLEILSRELGAGLERLEREIYDLAGERFNINSPSQLGKVLFEKLKLPLSRKIKTGYSTDYDALTRLSRAHALPAEILKYRQLGKLKSTYVDALPRMVNPRTGRVHTSFNQTGTATGRLSSSDPNLQNIPIRTDLGRRIREAFVPRDERHLFLAADYSQIDLRIMAHLSQDPALGDAFARDEDIHTATAMAIFGVGSPGVTPEMRRQAKTINFGIIYGMSAYGLSRELEIEPGAAQKFIDLYFAHYAGVRAWIERSLAEATERGYVTTILNRRRYVPELKHRSQTTRELGGRIAINTPIQGSAADLITIAMREIATEIGRAGWPAMMLLQIHDELLFEVAREKADEFGVVVRGVMENAWRFTVPLKVNVKTGENWGQL
ncbi:MAG: DNA polymerase I [Candidatus Aureabacteria bacterium]|nr:DNA polymerase I [Candidatus Auribacterota bacterium]